MLAGAGSAESHQPWELGPPQVIRTTELLPLPHVGGAMGRGHPARMQPDGAHPRHSRVAGYMGWGSLPPPGHVSLPPAAGGAPATGGARPRRSRPAGHRGWGFFLPPPRQVPLPPVARGAHPQRSWSAELPPRLAEIARGVRSRLTTGLGLLPPVDGAGRGG
jgi:hypothetical protein